MQYIILSLSIVNLFLGGIILVHSNHQKQNVVFLFFAFCVSLWTFNNFYLRINPIVETLRISYGLGIIVGFSFYIWCYFFLDRKLPVYAKYLVMPLTAIIFVITLFTDRVVKELYSVQRFGYEGKLGNFFIIYSVYFSVFTVLVFYNLLRGRRNATTSLKKSQISDVMYGTLFFATTSFFVSFYIPTFYNTLRFTIFDNISFSVLLFCIVYSIVKDQLFINRKVILTEIFTFILWISLFIRILLAQGTFDTVVSGLILTTTVIIGIFLIRSVIKEVKLREQIEKLADDLQRANQGQASLMHFMNHQVKGRFGNARNIFAELLTDDYGVIPDTAKPLLQKGLDETKMGVDYVQNILRGASAENGTLPYDMKSMDYKAVVEEVFAKQKEYAEKKGLAFELDVKNGTYNMVGDSVQLGEATRNLIDNSINYTEVGGIKVTLTASPTHPENIRLEIKDTGVGLTDEDKTKLFKAGGRGAESLKVNTNSTGYGLVFVKGVIEAHKGKVWAESEGRGKGSTFIIELPK